MICKDDDGQVTLYNARMHFTEVNRRWNSREFSLQLAFRTATTSFFSLYCSIHYNSRPFLRLLISWRHARELPLSAGLLWSASSVVVIIGTTTVLKVTTRTEVGDCRLKLHLHDARFLRWCNNRINANWNELGAKYYPILWKWIWMIANPRLVHATGDHWECDWRTSNSVTAEESTGQANVVFLTKIGAHLWSEQNWMRWFPLSVQPAWTENRPAKCHSFLVGRPSWASKSPATMTKSVECTLWNNWSNSWCKPSFASWEL